MNDKLEYREAGPADEAALAELWWLMQASHHEYEPLWYADHGEEPCKASWRTHFRGLLQDQNAVVVVACASGTPIGMIVAQFSGRPPIYTLGRMVAIASTVVHPAFRRQGVFRDMLAFLEDKARAAGIKVLKLSVHHQNHDAQYAYEKSGFIPETTGMIKWLAGEE